MKLLLAGASTEPVCGTRDYARTLAEPLRRAGADVRTVWWERGERPLADWAEELRSAAHDSDVVLWQYSVFTYSRHGLPTLVPRALGALRGATLVTVCHELVFPWGRRGVRGAVHASTQRAALLPVVHASRGLVVTTEERRAWLDTRAWLPRRPVRFLPVVSNVKPAQPGSHDGHERNGRGLRVGVFGFRREALPVELVVEALTRVPQATLVLVGAPGPDAPEAARWRKAATAAGDSDLVSFTGVLEPDALAAELAGLDVVLFPDPIGPTPRRGTLAAALSHGKPVIAFDGPQTWSEYLRAGALLTVPRTTQALAEALGRLADAGRRAEQSARATAFHDARLAPDVIARGLVEFATEVRNA